MKRTEPRIVVMASGRGSNFQAIVRAIDSRTLRVKVAALVSDRKDSAVLEWATERGIPSHAIDCADRIRFDQELLKIIQPLEPRFLVLAGFLRVVSPVVIEAFRDERGYSRVVNVHPSLLPAFPGLRSYAQAYRHGVKVTGVTVHLVEEQVDTGPICAQESFAIEDTDTVEQIEAKGLAVEHRLYPEALHWICAENFKVEIREGRICVSPN